MNRGGFGLRQTQFEKLGRTFADDCGAPGRLRRGDAAQSPREAALAVCYAP